MLIEWSPEYSLNHREVDGQHQRLFGLMNALHAAMNARKTNDVLEKLIAELRQYALDHFAMEERLMVKLGYDHFSEHRNAHREFSEKMERFEADFKAGKALLSLDVFRYLADWIRQHILVMDMEYGKLL